MSAWARLLDRLAYQFGILFIVSAGNHARPFQVQQYTKRTDFEDANSEEKSRATIASVGALMAERRLLSPAEAINGLTIGAANIDAVSAINRRSARTNVDPHSNLVICNPSSALGPGFANSVKPDLLMPGSREHLSFVGSGQLLSVAPANASRAHGLKVAAPPASLGRENFEHFTGGSSAAAALASRTCHRIHDALESAYGDSFLNLAHIERATLLKALIVHTASWPESTASQIKQVLGPDNSRQHVAQKNNIRRFLGYGVGEPEWAIACASDRATFWANGYLPPNKAVTVHVPIPSCVNARAIPHSLHATLAWFAPVAPGRQSYRIVRLTLNPEENLDALQLKSSSCQPDQNQVKKGTVFSQRWAGSRSIAVGADQVVSLRIQREPDQGETLVDEIPFAIAVTYSMPGVVGIYDEVRTRVSALTKVAVR